LWNSPPSDKKEKPQKIGGMYGYRSYLNCGFKLSVSVRNNTVTQNANYRFEKHCKFNQIMDLGLVEIDLFTLRSLRSLGLRNG
jgi:hypothetical protein